LKKVAFQVTVLNARPDNELVIGLPAVDVKVCCVVSKLM
jgi:hypothetical protein